MRPLVTIVVPSIGRAQLLEGCLASLARCRPRPEEVLIVDLPGSPDVQELAERFEELLGTRMIPCERTGVGYAVNLGFRAAHGDTVIVTNDDCTVSPDWIETACAFLERLPGGI